MNAQQTQRTIKREIAFSGIGVHLGCKSTITLAPAPADHGIIIYHTHFPKQRIRIGCVIPEEAMHATVIRQGTIVISTIEHVMAALHALQIDNVEIAVDAHEFPILDGSALPFMQALEAEWVEISSAPKHYITPKDQLIFENQDGRMLCVTPASSDDFRLFVSYEAIFAQQLIGTQFIAGELTQNFFTQEVAPARTFGFLEQLPFLRSHGLAQGTSLGNTGVIGPDGYMNELRFVDEFVRHKYLDLIGDLFLTGYQLIGKVEARKTGHNFNRMIVKHIIENPDQWVII